MSLYSCTLQYKKTESEGLECSWNNQCKWRTKTRSRHQTILHNARWDTHQL